jgi:hypothetical protein
VPAGSVLQAFSGPAFVPADEGALLVADFDGDGVLDVVMVSTLVDFLKGNGDGTFAEAIANPGSDFNPDFAVAGDFDEDGKPDLIYPVFAGLGFATGLGAGRFAAPQIVRLDARAFALAAADVDGDGHLDLLVVESLSAGFPDSHVHFLRGNGDGTFAPGVSIGVVSPSPIVFADFTGDGVGDVLAADASELDVLPGRGDGTFGPRIPSPVSLLEVGPIAVGDVDGDGHLDVAIGSVAGGSTVAVLLGDGQGSFSLVSSFAQGSAEVALADLDGDGHLDLISLSTGTEFVATRSGAGDGTFGPLRAAPTPVPTNSFRIADVDRDGWPDVVERTRYSIGVARGQCQ